MGVPGVGREPPSPARAKRSRCSLLLPLFSFFFIYFVVVRRWMVWAGGAQPQPSKLRWSCGRTPAIRSTQLSCPLALHGSSPHLAVRPQIHGSGTIHGPPRSHGKPSPRKGPHTGRKQRDGRPSPRKGPRTGRNRRDGSWTGENRGEEEEVRKGQLVGEMAGIGRTTWGKGKVAGEVAGIGWTTWGGVQVAGEMAGISPTSWGWSRLAAATREHVRIPVVAVPALGRVGDGVVLPRLPPLGVAVAVDVPLAGPGPGSRGRRRRRERGPM